MSHLDAKTKDLKRYGMSQRDHQLRVSLFGEFDVVGPKGSLVERSRKKSKPWTLLKYLLTGNRNVVTSDALMDDLWPNSESDSQQPLHLCVHRLRRLLATAIVSGEGVPLIIGQQGTYSFNWDSDHWVDAHQFEALYHRAKQGPVNDETTWTLYKDALALYTGDCLAEHQEEAWAIEVREYYRSLYRSVVLDYTNALLRLRQYHEVLAICNSAKLPQVDEDVEGQTIRALIYQGDLKQARIRYERITKRLYSDMGIAPSLKLRDLYRLLCASEKGERLFDVASDSEALNVAPLKSGPLLCDSDVFRYLFTMEKRKLERTGQCAHLVCVVNTDKHGQLLSEERATAVTGSLIQGLQELLRSSDSICRWNSSQILVLSSTHAADDEKVLKERLERKLSPLARTMAAKVGITVRQVQSVQL